MSRHEKTLDKVLRGRADANIRFRDLRGLLVYLGFQERIRGSHPKGSKAKPYQVKQVRAVILEYELGPNRWR